MTLHVFNPGHDEALAANTPYYTDSRAAQILSTDLRSLPQHWAQEGDLWTLPTSSRGWESVHTIAPWGWDMALAHRLLRLGAPLRLLPEEEDLQRIRQLSSRHTAVELLPKISPYHAMWCETMIEVEQALRETPSAYIKAPWSSSGRGILRAKGQLSASEVGRIARWLRQQGAVVVEQAYEKQQDFAIEFEASKDGIRYAGLSLFSTEGMGAYSGNLVAEEALLRQQLPPLEDTIATLRTALERHLIGYEGPLGVDMMYLKDGSIHPCVEINLRRTMGWVAIQLRHLIPANDCHRYTIRPFAPLAHGERNLTPEGRIMQAILQPHKQGLLKRT